MAELLAFARCSVSGASDFPHEHKNQGSKNEQIVEEQHTYCVSQSELLKHANRRTTGIRRGKNCTKMHGATRTRTCEPGATLTGSYRPNSFPAERNLSLLGLQGTRECEERGTMCRLWCSIPTCPTSSSDICGMDRWPHADCAPKASISAKVFEECGAK